MNLSLGFRPNRLGILRPPFGPIEAAVEALAAWGPGLYSVDVEIGRDGSITEIMAEATVDDDGDIHIDLCIPLGSIAAEERAADGGPTS